MTIAHSTQSVFSQQQNENWLPPDNPQLLLLRNWQIQRLSHTYAEFKASSRYNLAADFFLNDIYSPIGFSDRHHEIDHIYNLMRRILPEKMLKAMRTEMNLENNMINLRVLIKPLVNWIWIGGGLMVIGAFCSWFAMGRTKNPSCRTGE